MQWRMAGVGIENARLVWVDRMLWITKRECLVMKETEELYGLLGMFAYLCKILGVYGYFS